MKALRVSGLLSLVLFLYSFQLVAREDEPKPHVNRCAALKYLSPEALGEIKPEFLAKHDGKYTHELEAPPPRNQCQYGDCWVYSAVGGIEQSAFKATNQRLELSEQYIVAHDLMIKSWRSLKDPNYTFGEGGFVVDAERIIRNFGAVPSASWKPRVDFEKKPHPGRLMIFIKNRIAEYHVASEKINEGPEKEELRQAAARDIQDIVDVYFGELPKSFDYNGKKYTPLEFSHAFLPFTNRTPLLVYPSELREKREARNGRHVLKNDGLERDMTYQYSYEGWAQIEARIIRSLADGQAIPLSFEVVDGFIDDKTGIMSLAAFHTPEGFSPVGSSLRHKYDFEGGGHAIEIVGVDVDEQGHIRKLKLRNSWGEKHGDNGFYHMYADYFRAYLEELYFR